MWVGGVDGEFTFGFLHAGGVEDLFGRFVDDLDDGFFEIDFVREVAGGLAAVVVS